MNTINNLTQKILDEAQEAALRTTKTAETEAQALLEEYRTRAGEEAGAILAQARAKADNTALRADSQADITARSRRLAARRDLIAAAFQKAQEKLCAMDQEKYLAWMAGQVQRCQSADAQLVLNEKDRAALGEALVKRAQGGKGSLTLAPDTGSFSGGFLLREGSVETNCTFEVLIAAGREDLEGEIAAVLFG